MAAKRGAATIHYGEDFVEAKLENHGTFRTSGNGFRYAKRHYIARALVAAVASIYDGHHDGFETKAYWRQYPLDILAVIVADCHALHIHNEAR
jgi:hypothetical protein